MTEQVNLEQWKRQREQVSDLAKGIGTGTTSAEALALQTAKLQNMTAGVMDAVLNDMAYLHGILEVTQNQMSTVAQQSFLALEVLKRKNIITAEQIHELHKEVVAEQLAKIEASKQEALLEAQKSRDLSNEDPNKLEEYKELVAAGFSDEEARITVWPEDVIEGAEIIRFPVGTPGE